MRPENARSHYNLVRNPETLNCRCVNGMSCFERAHISINLNIETKFHYCSRRQGNRGNRVGMDSWREPHNNSQDLGLNPGKTGFFQWNHQKSHDKRLQLPCASLPLLWENIAIYMGLLLKRRERGPEWILMILEDPNLRDLRLLGC